MIERHGVVLGIALSALLVPALLGTSASPTHHNQVADSAWLAQLQPPHAYAASTSSDCTGCGATLAELPSPDAAAAAVESAPIADPDPWATMVLREGDTLSDLAVWFGISAEDIAAANGATVDDYMMAGDTIAIPIPQSQFSMPPAPVIYVAEPEPEPAPVVSAPAPTITPTPSRHVFTGGADAVIAAICSMPWPCDKMVRIAMCESGLNPGSFNPAGYYGLFQLNTAVPGWDDPYVNSQAAYNLKYAPAAAKGDGLSPWPACRNY